MRSAIALIVLVGLGACAGPATDSGTVDKYKTDAASWQHDGRDLANSPGSVSVVPRAVLDDRAAHTLQDAVRSAPGVTF